MESDVLTVMSVRFDLWLPLPAGGDAPPEVSELFGMLAGSAYVAEIPCAFVGDWWMCQGVVPGFAFLLLGMQLWADVRGATFRVLKPGSPTFPPEVAATLNDLED